jgi:hypothetical protein
MGAGFFLPHLRHHSSGRSVYLLLQFTVNRDEDFEREWGKGRRE